MTGRHGQSGWSCQCRTVDFCKWDATANPMTVDVVNTALR